MMMIVINLAMVPRSTRYICWFLRIKMIIICIWGMIDSQKCVCLTLAYSLWFIQHWVYRTQGKPAKSRKNWENLKNSEKP